MTDTHPNGFCEECGEPIYDKHEFVATLKQDHHPETPGIPAETIHKDSYECPNCGYCPTDY